MSKRQKQMALLAVAAVAIIWWLLRRRNGVGIVGVDEAKNAYPMPGDQYAHGIPIVIGSPRDFNLEIALNYPQTGTCGCAANSVLFPAYQALSDIYNTRMVQMLDEFYDLTYDAWSDRYNVEIQ